MSRLHIQCHDMDNLIYDRFVLIIHYRITISINIISKYSYISVTQVTYRIRDTLEYSILLRYIHHIYVLYSIYCTFPVSYILVRQSSCLGSLEPASLSCVMFCYTRSRNICFQYFVVNIVFHIL